MTIYGNLLSDIQLEYATLEAYEFLNESDEILDEGVNLDITKDYFSIKKKYKNTVKECLAALKKNDLNKAKQCIKEMNDSINDMREVINNIDQDEKSIVFGNIIYAVFVIIQCFSPILENIVGNKIYSKLSGAAVAKFGDGTKSTKAISTAANILFKKSNLATGVTVIYRVIKEAYIQKKAFDKEYKNATSEEAKKKVCNMYRNRVIKMLDDIQRKIGTLEMLISTKEEFNK